jgi:hypothetical protein
VQQRLLGGVFGYNGIDLAANNVLKDNQHYAGIRNLIDDLLRHSGMCDRVSRCRHFRLFLTRLPAQEIVYY